MFASDTILFSTPIDANFRQQGTPLTPDTIAHSVVAVRRFEVRSLPSIGDPRADALIRAAEQLNMHPAGVRSAKVYLIEADLDEAACDRILNSLLADPARETGLLGAMPAEPRSEVVEVAPLPGVMDPAAATVTEAVRDLLGLAADFPIAVSTGMRYDITGLTRDQTDELARRVLYNPVIEQVHRTPWTPERFPEARPADQTLRHVEITTLDDDALKRLSREGHLFLSLDEMRAIQQWYTDAGREPTDIELETLAQTWSEHCVHKTLKSGVRYHSSMASDPIDWSARRAPGVTVEDEGTVRIDNLLKSTVAAATFELIDEGVDWTLSVFHDNSGVVKFTDDTAVCIKVETHNRPSAIEPYGGAATGIGGCIRDIIGTGLAAKPIAATDVFCVAHPDQLTLPPGVIHPRQILTRVVDGVRDYGNRMGIPTINGAVYFDDRYIGNPLVFCGCIGTLPTELSGGDGNASAKPGDLIVALGGRTGKDGIHGATFSSAELTDTHADEFSHAVQIGNAIEEKRTLDAIMRARSEHGKPLFSAITDCGAGGFSSAIGEMGEKVGAEVDLDRAPLKYAGLRYDEIWISESQERMVLAVPRTNLDALQKICDEEGVELSVLGTFGSNDEQGEAQLVLRFEGNEVGRMTMHFLHEGIPMPVRDASWTAPEGRQLQPAERVDNDELLLKLLSHPNLASKRWIIRQYDHEVQGNTLLKPLVGPGGDGPGDAAVIQPVPESEQGLAISCGLQTNLGTPDVAGGDPYTMTLSAIDECVRNLVCVGTDPDRIAILDNFCWPSCDRPQNIGALTRCAIACYDGAKAYRTPFVSGKDSLNNQFRYKDPSGNEVLVEIPPTLLVTGMGVVPSVDRLVTMDMKASSPGSEPDELVLIGLPDRSMAPHAVSMTGSHADLLLGRSSTEPLVPVDLELGPKAARFVADLIGSGEVRAAHDCSEGGLLACVAEMLLASFDPNRASPGAGLFIDRLMNGATEEQRRRLLFGEGPSRYVLQVGPGESTAIADRARALGLGAEPIGIVTDDAQLDVFDSLKSTLLSVGVADCLAAFTKPLDW
ncbi:phosphoribosylformylglycinamidine synthase subunit PurS [Phycisphaerales bacterium ac7]